MHYITIVEAYLHLLYISHYIQCSMCSFLLGFPELEHSRCVCRRSCAANGETSLCGVGPRNHGVHF